MRRGFKGQILSVGQTVVWPSRRGSSLWMNEGVIVEVGEKQIRVRYQYTPFPSSSSECSLTRLDNVVVVA